MSVISLLVFDDQKLPSLAAVAEEARLSGDPIEFIERVDLRSHTGFLPVRAFGRDTGFEHYFQPVPDGALPDEAAKFGSHHIIARTGSDFEEGRAALLYLKVVSRLTDGAYIYPDDAIVIGSDKVEAYLDSQIAEYGKYIK